MIFRWLLLDLIFVAISSPITIEHNHVIVEIKSVWMTNDWIQQFSIISRQLNNFGQMALAQLWVHLLHETVGHSSLLYLSPFEKSSHKINRESDTSNCNNPSKTTFLKYFTHNFLPVNIYLSSRHSPSNENTTT